MPNSPPSCTTASVAVQRPGGTALGGHLLAKLRDIVALSKPRITLLVLGTTVGGAGLASGRVDWLTVVTALVATALTVSAANALNCYLEREIDGRMERTRNRPLPAGRLDPRVALVLGVALALLSLPLLWLAVNPLTSALGAAALGTYVFLYTPLKRYSPLALPVGAVPGAIPPLMGYSAATGTLDPSALALFGILFLWQIPHFLAIALFRKDDYARAGLKVVSVTHGDRVTKIHAALWAAVLLPVSLLPYFLGAAGLGYLLVASVLGAAFVGLAGRGLWRDAGARWAKALFGASILYLLLLFVVLVVDAT
jgi:protoheme IX farnesyltransferase